MQTFEPMIYTWKKEIAKHLYHPTLVEYTGVPELSNLRMISLFLPLLQENHDENSESFYATAIIYLALSSHDHVNEKGTPSKEQQLRVLAGDYYSGMYYQMLANQEKSSLIKRLTNSIRLMTEAKTVLYERKQLTENEKSDARTIIATAPTLALFEELNLERYNDLSIQLGYLAMILEDHTVSESLLINQSVQLVQQTLTNSLFLDDELKQFISSQVNQAVSTSLNL